MGSLLNRFNNYIKHQHFSRSNFTRIKTFYICPERSSNFELCRTSLIAF